MSLFPGDQASGTAYQWNHAALDGLTVSEWILCQILQAVEGIIDCPYIVKLNVVIDYTRKSGKSLEFQKIFLKI